jgi:uncharacterized membrane protein YjjB (DUF3815 family)
VPAASEHESGTRERRQLERQRLERQQRELAARAALRPLEPGERPTSLLIAIAVAGALALGVTIGALSIHDLSRHGGSLPAGLFIAGVLLALANGMYRRRYWAVLAFEALLAFQIVVTSLALVVAETALAASICALSVGLGGWLFWKLVRVMGRIQATELAARQRDDQADEALR